MNTKEAQATDTTERAGLPPAPRMPRTVVELNRALRQLSFLERCRERYGDIFTLRTRLMDPLVVLCDPEDIKQVFTGDPGVVRAGETRALLKPLLGPRSVLVLDDFEHLMHRKLMLAPFHGERMRRYGELTVDATRKNVERWPVGKPFALRPRMQTITLETILRAVFGVTEAEQVEHVRAPLQRMLAWISSVPRMALYVALGPQRIEHNRSYRAMIDPVDEAVFGEIRRRRAEPDLDRREDILSMLIQARYEDGSQMSEQELRDELISLLIAGHETTTTSLSWAFEHLLRHEDKLERLRQEILAGEDAYMMAVIKETLRLRPVVAITIRKLAAPMKLGGYTIPVGAWVTPCIYLVHRREDIYPEPHSFRPERFLEQSPGTYTWIPFGGGVRRCPGASFAQFQMKTVLETVLSDVELRLASSRTEQIAKSVLLKPRRGVPVIVTRRRAMVSTNQQLTESSDRPMRHPG